MTRREVVARSACSLDDNADWIAQRKEARKDQGPVLVLDAGDYSMGTASAAATREIGGELQLMSRMGYDATTFGNHDFDFGPDGVGKSIGVAAKVGRAPPVLASPPSFGHTQGRPNHERCHAGRPNGAAHAQEIRYA
jgi:hypothetical protein